MLTVSLPQLFFFRRLLHLSYNIIPICLPPHSRVAHRYLGTPSLPNENLKFIKTVLLITVGSERVKMHRLFNPGTPAHNNQIPATHQQDRLRKGQKRTICCQWEGPSTSQGRPKGPCNQLGRRHRRGYRISMAAERRHGGEPISARPQPL